MSSVVYQEVSNDFTNPNQKIMGHEIVSVEYGAFVPTESDKPNRAGKLRIQIPEAAEDNNLHAWFSVQTETGFVWCPIGSNATSGGDGEVPSDVVRKNQANSFNHTEQKIGEHQIPTIIDGGVNGVPNAVLPDFDGQIYFSYQHAGTPEARGAAWIAKGNQWLPIASGGGIADDSNLAKLDAANVFTNIQKIGETGNQALFTSGRRSSFDPTDAGSVDVVPYAAGDTIIRRYTSIDGVPEHQVFTAMNESDETSWVKTFDSAYDETHISDMIEAVDLRVTALRDTVTVNSNDLDTMATQVGQNANDITDVETEIGLLKPKVQLLESDMTDTRDRVEALETNHSTHATAISTLNSGKLSKTGGELTGQLRVKDNGESIILEGGASHISGYSNSTTRKWYIGKGSSSSDDFTIRNQAHDTAIYLMSNKVKSTDPIYVNNNKVVIDTELAAVETKVTAAETLIESLQTELNTAEATVVTLQSELDAAEVKIAAAETGITDNNDLIVAHKELIDYAIGTANANTNNISTMNNTLETQEASITSLAGAVNGMETEVNSVKTDVTTLNTDMVTVKGAITSNNGDIDTLQTELNAAEVLIATLQTELDAAEVKITALEDTITALGDAHPPLPETLTADSYLVINEAGTGFECSTETVTEVNGIINGMVAGVQSGDQLLNSKCMGGDTIIYSNDTPSSDTSKSNFLFCTPASGQTKTMTLGDIKSYDATSLTATGVREGCVYTVVNAGAGTVRLATDGSIKFQSRTAQTDTYDVPSNTTALFHPQIWDGGTKVYNFIGKFSNA